MKSVAFPLLLFLFFVSFHRLQAVSPLEGEKLGPLGGHNVYARDVPWYNFSAEQASARALGSLNLQTSLYHFNEFRHYTPSTSDPPLIFNPDGTLSESSQKDLIAIDYESTIAEVGMSWQAFPSWRFIADWTLHIRYGGFLDSIIEGVHRLFGFPNGSREYFNKDRSYWNVKSDNAPLIFGEGSTVALGNLNLKAHWTIVDYPQVSWAGAVALKIPTGKKQGGFGSGYPDLALATLVDWHPHHRWGLYFQTGVIFPLDPYAYIMWQNIPAIEFRASRILSLLFQMNLQTSPLRGTIPYFHPILGTNPIFTLIQSSIKVGIKVKGKNLTWQFYVEEDFLTWESSDILFFFGAEFSLR